MAVVRRIRYVPVARTTSEKATHPVFPSICSALASIDRFLWRYRPDGVRLPLAASTAPNCLHHGTGPSLVEELGHPMQIPWIGASHVTASILVVGLHHTNAQVNRDLEGLWRTRSKALDGSAS